MGRSGTHFAVETLATVTKASPRTIETIDTLFGSFSSSFLTHKILKSSVFDEI